MLFEHVHKELHLRQGGCVSLAENIGAPDEGLAVLEGAGLDIALEVIQRHFRHQRPAEAPLHHLAADHDVIHHKIARIVGHAVLIAPAGHLGADGGVAAVVDIKVIGDGPVLVLLAADEADILLREQELGAVPRILAPQHRHVQRGIQHLLVDVPAVAGSDVEAYLRVGFVVLGQHLGQTVVGEVHRDAGPQGAAGFALDGGQLAAHLFHLAGSGGAVEQHLFTCRREADALPRAQDDLHPQLLFQRLDAFGQCRLGHVQFVRCVGDVARLVQRVQQLVIFFVHRSSPPIALYFSYHSCLHFIAALFL